MFKPTFIAHALGSINNKTYTNSKEAFLRSYKLGFRLMEVDLSLTKDEELVCFHDACEYKLNLNKDISQISLNEFIGSSYYNEYTPLSFEGLLKLLVKHPDVKLIIDFKNNDFDKMATLLKEKISELDNNNKLLNRIILQIFHPNDLELLKQRYKKFCNVIFILYKSSFSDSEVVSFVKNNINSIRAVAVSIKRFNKNLAILLKELNMPIYVHTVNKQENINYLTDNYVSGFYTDATNISLTDS